MPDESAIKLLWNDTSVLSGDDKGAQGVAIRMWLQNVRFVLGKLCHMAMLSS